jgi:hypothetical protein
LILFDNGQIYFKLEQEYANIGSSNFTNALDLLFKSFAVLNVEYAPEATHLFKFLEIIFGINYGTKMPSLLIELDTQILNFI